MILFNNQKSLYLHINKIFKVKMYWSVDAIFQQQQLNEKQKLNLIKHYIKNLKKEQVKKRGVN